MDPKLSDDELHQELKDLPGWERMNGAMTRTYDRSTFRGATAFVNTIADLAERADHHPDLDIRYSRVRVTLTTHDAGGITRKDLQLARQIEAAAE